MGRETDILLLGNSVRYLAQSGSAHGLAPLAVDAFGDADTALAGRAVRAASLDPRALVQAVPSRAPATGMSCVYTAGFESAPERLGDLPDRGFRLMGNNPEALRLIADGARWFGLLDELDIAVPRFRFDPPDRRSGWLFKRQAGAGGVGVHRADRREAGGVAGYYQAYVKGAVCSLLFAADGERIAEIGWNRLWARYPAAGDFRFAGAITMPAPIATHREVMTGAAQRLTAALSLRGVNGLDFVVGADGPLLLDVNPRPPASLELYERDLPHGGLRCHLAACDGDLPDTPRLSAVRGLRIVYARRDLNPRPAAWPRGIQDRPVAGTRVGAHEPLCSVHATGPDPFTVEARLREMSDVVHELVYPFAEDVA